MADREKLIELLKEVEYAPLPGTPLKSKVKDQFHNHVFEIIADHLISNGVVVQECGLWNIVEEPNCVDTQGRPCKHAECSVCGFTWSDLYSVKNYFKSCPHCGKKLKYGGI